MLGSLILYLRGMRIMMFQLSGFYCNWFVSKATIIRTHIRGLVTPLITTHEPPSRPGAEGPGQRDSGKASCVHAW